MHNGNRPPRRENEKAKDFKGAIARLFKELSGFKILIFISLILASLGSILSIFAPDKLSDLTNTISEGLVVNKENMKKLSEKTSESISEERMNTLIPSILEIDLSENTISKIENDNDISNDEKETFYEVLKDIKENNSLILLTNLSDKILDYVLPSTMYDEVIVSTNDKFQFLSCIKDNTLNYPESITSIIFSDLNIDGKNISSHDQLEFIKLMSENSSQNDSQALYSKIDKMPDDIKNVLKPFMDIDKIKSLVLFLATLYICSALFNYIESLLMTNVSNKFAKFLRESISKKINRLPLKYFDNHATGDLLSRVTNDVDLIAQSMNNSLSTLVSAFTLFIGSIIMMFYTNWIMAITAIFSSLFGFMFMGSILGKSQKYFTAKQEELGNLTGHIEEIYSGLNVVKVYNGKKESDAEFDKYNNRVYDANRKSQFLSGLMMPMMNFIGNFGYVAVCIVGALLVINNKISFGVIVAFITYVRLFISPLSQIAQGLTSLQSTAAASERVFEFMDEEEMKSQKKIKKVLDKNKVKGNIEFENVTFTYDGNELPTINNFSAKAFAGQKVAIVGPTGAGKTTIVNLLMKFYEINSGDIKIDGISTKDLSRENIHSLFTMVLQDTWLFNGTIKENIIYNRHGIELDKVEEVCKVVGLDHFIRTLPNGYNSYLSDNDNISAGQRQLLTIARGMIEDSPFLILDEATSNVDTRTEELVQKAMDKLTEGKTSFIIAHRLSTIKNADLILVMKNGNIIEQGNHEQLIEQNGFYAELYNSQFEL